MSQHITYGELRQGQYWEAASYRNGQPVRAMIYILAVHKLSSGDVMVDHDWRFLDEDKWSGEARFTNAPGVTFLFDAEDRTSAEVVFRHPKDPASKRETPAPSLVWRTIGRTRCCVTLQPGEGLRPGDTPYRLEV